MTADPSALASVARCPHQLPLPPPPPLLPHCSCDGLLKFWKKVPGPGLEHAKTFRAHLGPLVGLAVSSDGLRIASSGDDGTVKLFDSLSFDMVDILRTPFQPGAIAVSGRARAARRLALECDEGKQAARFVAVEGMTAIRVVRSLDLQDRMHAPLRNGIRVALTTGMGQGCSQALFFASL
jgi:hypothetical protein